MAYQRRILHYGTDPDDFLDMIQEEAVAGCWFDLHRLGGCGAGELRLKQGFVDRANLQPGEWIAFEYASDERWYFGRIEQIDTVSPAGMRIQLQGAGIQLNEVFPGALQPNDAGAKPHLYVREDRFSADPDPRPIQPDRHAITGFGSDDARLLSTALAIRKRTFPQIRLTSTEK